MIIRYTAPPTKYDIAPYKTLCKIHLNDSGSDSQLFIQMAEDEMNPVWMSVEELVIQAFKPLFEDQAFLDDCLNNIKITP